jgi:alpha-galactosidase
MIHRRRHDIGVAVQLPPQHVRMLLSLATALALCSGVLACSMAVASKPTSEELGEAGRFVAAKFSAPQLSVPQKAGLVVAVNNGPISQNRAEAKIGAAKFAQGLTCHAPSKVIVQLPSPGKKFLCRIGLDNNSDTARGRGTVVFSVRVGGRIIFRSDVFKINTPAKSVEVDLQGATTFALEVGDAGDGIAWDQADWAEARVELADGKTAWLGDLPILESQEGLFSADPPFSFTYDGKPSSEFLESWKTECKSTKLDDHRTSRTVTYSDPAGGLTVRCEAVEYDDYPTVEWTLYFKNTGAADTPIIENIQSLDVQWHWGGGQFLLHHNVGSPSNGTDYSPRNTIIEFSSAKQFAARGGCSSWFDMPYFNLERNSNEGLIVAIGWPGQWSAGFIRDSGLGIRILAGQELTYFKLHPNEEIRTPLSVLQFWKGDDWLHAQNVWRRWMIAHNIPRPDGKPPAPMLFASSDGKMDKATEESQLAWFNRLLEEKIQLDGWWMDAGWSKVGAWEVDKKRFPRGLKAVADRVHSKGMKTLLWFEPERVADDAWPAKNHPEWILGGKKGGLLDFGNPDALKWIADRVDKVISEEGIDIFRQDLNLLPLSYWRGADAEDRQGIAEIRHVTNLLGYMDELRRRHPNMLIDASTAGGRRSDLEMMRRALPLWRSDPMTNPASQQSMTCGIAMWIPYFGNSTTAWDGVGNFVAGKSPDESYGFWSSACPSLHLLFDVQHKGLDYEKIRKLTAQWREAMPCYYGDFYPLTDITREENDWAAWQFDRPERGDGIVQAFRRSASASESARPKLRGLDPHAKYQITDLTRNTGSGPLEISGGELQQEGLLVIIKEHPGAVVIKYQRAP